MGVSLLTITLVTHLYLTLHKDIGLNWLTNFGLLVFGIRIMRILLTYFKGLLLKASSTNFYTLEPTTF